MNLFDQCHSGQNYQWPTFQTILEIIYLTKSAFSTLMKIVVDYEFASPVLLDILHTAYLQEFQFAIYSNGHICVCGTLVSYYLIFLLLMS